MHMTYEGLWGHGLGDLEIMCGDDRITCYPGADDVTGGPGDA